MLRSFAEKLMRNRLVKRRLPNGVAIFVSPDSQLKYLKREFDQDLSAIAKEFITDSSVVWDVGANCGVLAFSAAKAKQIIAVEADPFLAHVLQESAALSGVSVTVVTAAVFSKPSLAKFSIARRGRASNFLTDAGGRSQTGGERSQIVVPTVTLDNLLDISLPPTFVKIDVEGAEIDVFEGAERLLGQARPTIYFEAGASTVDRCCEILKAANYRISQRSATDWLAQPE